MAKSKRKTKAEELQDAVAEAVGAGRELHLETVNFSDPNRPKTCLEVDFPILPINALATIESSSGAARKPIYLSTKWWARRQPSVFRAMLIAAAAKAPNDIGEAAKTVWDAYYANHQNNEAFRKLKVADIFMGGGTTIVEGSRLGMQMYGNDLNPVAWFVVKNEVANVSQKDVQTVLDAVEAEVKPQIMPFYTCDCPRGHKGKWTHKPTGKVMADDFDPLSLTPEQRPEYEYAGPEVIYTFWAKHGPCQASECNHRTPIMSSPIVAVKTLTVKAWEGKQCKSCSESFDVEQQEARIAPTASFVASHAEEPYTVMNAEGRYSCPHCSHEYIDAKAANDGESASLGKAKNKKIDLTLLVHPDWLKGSPDVSTSGIPFGGATKDSLEATSLWNVHRASTLRLVEVRGELPDHIALEDADSGLFATKKGGTVPKQACFTCQEPTCGLDQEVLKAIKTHGDTAPISAYAIHGYCPACNSERQPYNGRFFDVPNVSTINASFSEWARLKDTLLNECWPASELPFGFMTHQNNGGLPNHGYTHWWKMFNSRQLLVHTQFFRSLAMMKWTEAVELVVGIMPQVLRANCNFSFWNQAQDCIEPALGSANFHPKMTTVENCVFNSKIGRGNFRSYAETLVEAARYRKEPWDLVLIQPISHLIEGDISSKTFKLSANDPVTSSAVLECGSSTTLLGVADESIDLVITDPPFGGLMHYSELSDFFYVWLRLILKRHYPEKFGGEYVPKALEAVSNRARHPDNPDGFYQRLLTECWKSAHRVLKASGMLAFTFHHSEDEPWVAVLESLFEAGYYLEATYPIRSDDTKGEGGKPGTFGSQLIEFDIVHVCRKRLEESEAISWARLRRQIMKDVRQLQEIIEQHQKEGLGEADLQVIRRGKALEYYSRHYGKVYIEKGREEEFTVRDALVGINQLLDDESDTTSETPPVLAEPYTRQFLRLFADKSSLERDQMQKHLRGTGVSPSEFLERGWCSEEKKVFTVADPLEWANQWKGKSRKGMSRDFDQTYFLIGACYDDSGIKLSDTLNSGSFVPHPAISDLLDWFGKHGSDSNMKAAAKRAKQIYSSWLAKNTTQVVTQRTLFDLEDDE